MKLPQLEGSWAPLQYPQPLVLARRWSPVHVKMSSVRSTSGHLHDLLCIIHSHWFWLIDGHVAMSHWSPHGPQPDGP